MNLKEISQWTKPPKKKIVSVNFCRALFSLFGYLTLEDGTNGMSQNVSAELPFQAVKYLRTVQITNHWVMQALVCFCMVWFRVIWFGLTHLVLHT